MKIISLVPSITELLFDLGLKNQIIGRTKFCIHPQPEIKAIPQFGGTKKLHIENIIKANPDLIVANKEENLKSEIEELQKHLKVHVTDVSNLDENNQMILDLGHLTNAVEAAQNIVNVINAEFDRLPRHELKPNVLYLIWKKPMMSVGQDTFIHNMLDYAGFANICGQDSRYPEIKSIENLHPDYVFLSSEPFPFKEKHMPEIQEKFPNAKMVLVDGEMFSWYGSRMRLAPEYFIKLQADLGV